jgi:hypothetical protein
MAEVQQKLYTAEELWELLSESDEYQFAELMDGELFMAGGSGGEATMVAAEILTFIRVLCANTISVMLQARMVIIS